MSYYPPYRSSRNNIKVELEQLKMMLKILLMLMLVVLQVRLI